MNIEIEAKFKVEDHAGIRESLKKLGAAAGGHVLQKDYYFDCPKCSMEKKDSAIRLRQEVRGYERKIILSFKGPKQAGKFKKRQEIQFGVDDLDSAILFLEAIGFSISLVIEKRRVLWQFKNCEVSLDELPVLGKFIEIEGPDEKTIAAVQSKLGLENLEHIKEGYATLIHNYRKAKKLSRKEFVFS